MSFWMPSAPGSVRRDNPGCGIPGNFGPSAKRPFELPTAVYRVDAQSGQATVAAVDFVRPNGLAFSPNGKRLYNVDSAGDVGGAPHIRLFAVLNGSRLANG